MGRWRGCARENSRADHVTPTVLYPRAA